MRTLDIPASKAGRREWIKARLRLAGYTFGTLARELGMARGLHKVLWVPYPRIERIIADKLGVRPQDLWPDRYDDNGNPNRPKGRRSRSAAKAKTVRGRAKRGTHASNINITLDRTRNVQTHEAA